MYTTDDSSLNDTLAIFHLSFFSFTFYINTHIHLIYINIIIYTKYNIVYSIYYFMFISHMSLSFLRYYIHFTLRLSFSLFYVLNSKFNWKPVFKSQINRVFFYLLRPLEWLRYFYCRFILSI